MKKFLSIYQYLLLFLLIASSGFPFFYSNQEYIVIGVILAVIYLMITKQIEKIDKYFIIFTLFLMVWETMQGLYLGALEFRPVLGTTFRLSFAYLTLKALGLSFFYKYIKIIKFFAAVSLVFYGLFWIPSITEYLIEFSKPFKPIFLETTTEFYGYSAPNIILFNFHGFEFTPHRNSGPFWEPGAFAIFINLAIVFSIFRKKKLSWKDNMVLILALLTTLSTAGYIVFFLIVFLFYMQSGVKDKKDILRYIYALTFIILFFYLFNSLDFLGEKVQDNINIADETTSSRFGSALADFTLWSNNPIIGYGRNTETMYGVTYWDLTMMHRNNGLTKLFVTWGILALFLLYRMWVSSYIISNCFRIKIGKFILFFTLILSAFSQGIFQYPFFMIFYFLHLICFKNPYNSKFLKYSVRAKNLHLYWKEVRK